MLKPTLYYLRRFRQGDRPVKGVPRTTRRSQERPCVEGLPTLVPDRGRRSRLLGADYRAIQLAGRDRREIIVTQCPDQAPGADAPLVRAQELSQATDQSEA